MIFRYLSLSFPIFHYPLLSFHYLSLSFTIPHYLFPIFSLSLTIFPNLSLSFTISHKCTFRIFFWGGGGWQAVSLGGGMTVMEKREILGGWVTKECLKCTKKLGYGGRVTFDNTFKSSWDISNLPLRL